MEKQKKKPINYKRKFLSCKQPWTWIKAFGCPWQNDNHNFLVFKYTMLYWIQDWDIISQLNSRYYKPFFIQNIYNSLVIFPKLRRILLIFQFLSQSYFQYNLTRALLSLYKMIINLFQKIVWTIDQYLQPVIYRYVRRQVFWPWPLSRWPWDFARISFKIKTCAVLFSFKQL